MKASTLRFTVIFKSFAGFYIIFSLKQRKYILNSKRWRIILNVEEFNTRYPTLNFQFPSELISGKSELGHWIFQVDIGYSS